MNGNIYAVALCIVFCLVSAPCTAEWVSVAKTADESMEVFLDSEKAETQKSPRVVTLKNVYHKPKYSETEKKHMKESIRQSEYDCPGKKAKIRQVTIFYTDGSSEVTPGHDWKDVIPDTLGENLFKFICNLK